MSKDNNKRFKATTPGKRLFKLAGMSTSIASSYAGHKVKNVFANEDQKKESQAKLLKDIGSQITETLGEMKGAVMKVGQIVSQVKDMLPPEIAEQLAKLQSESPPMPYGMIRKQIADALGQAPEKIFKSFDEKPFAAASIGQVHKAITQEGDEVIVKVQYPGVEESCESDLKQIKRIMKIAGIVKVDKKILDQVFVEIEVALKEELDYINEAKNIELFQELYKDDESIVIPRVFKALSNKKILTLSYEPGDHMDSVKTPKYPQAMINQLGRRLFTEIIDQMLDHGMVHSDAHPGNFAFRPDGKIVFYDFGAIKFMKPELSDGFKRMITDFTHNDYSNIDKELKVLGFRKNDGKDLDAEFYAKWIDVMWPAFGHEAEFDFGQGKIHKAFIDIAKSIDVFEYMELFQPSPDAFGLERIFSGHYWSLCNLGVVTSFQNEVHERVARWDIYNR